MQDTCVNTVPTSWDCMNRTRLKLFTGLFVAANQQESLLASTCKYRYSNNT